MDDIGDGRLQLVNHLPPILHIPRKGEIKFFKPFWDLDMNEIQPLPLLMNGAHDPVCSNKRGAKPSKRDSAKA